MKNTEKILVIRYGTIGDTIFASPFYRELRKSKPNAQIDILADKISSMVMENCPYINNIIPIKKKYRDFFYYYKIFRDYDTVYFLKNDKFFSLTAFLSRIKNRIGFDVRRNVGLNLKYPYKEDKLEIDCYLGLLEISGVPVNSRELEVWIKEETEKKILENYDFQTRQVAVIQAKSRFSLKEWFPEKWTKVIEYLSNELGYQVVFFGSKNDNYSEIEDLLHKNIKYPPINLCGHLSVQESMAFIKHSKILIGIDSGLMHVAAAFKLPSVLLNGPTALSRWRPQNENCIVVESDFDCPPCLLQRGVKCHCDVQHPKCMATITEDKVISAICKLLEKK